MSDPENHDCSIKLLVSKCIEFEKKRSLQPSTLQTLNRYYDELLAYCDAQKLTDANQLTPEFFRTYSIKRTKGCGQAVVKGVIWSLRKLGDFIALREGLAESPAAALRHPKIQPRAKLPQYLSVAQLRSLLETAARTREQRELVILSLMATTGMRPFEIASLERGHIKLHQHRIDHRTKGGKLKRTPLSRSMVGILAEYLTRRTDDSMAAFVTARNKPVTKSWIRRMVHAAGAEAGIPFRLNCNHLRHTFATHAADRHGKLVTKALLGHSLLKTTGVYTHLSPRRFRAVMALHPYQSALGLGVTSV
jgi:site-specific recombinase XerD